MRIGRLVHDAIEHYSKACLKGKIESDAGLMERALGDALAKHPIQLANFPEVREALFAFAEKGIEVEKMLDAESQFRVGLPGGGIIEGRIDRVNIYKIGSQSVLEIIDYKNARKMSSVTEVKGDIQLGIYRYVGDVHLFQGHDLVRTGIYNTRYGVMTWDGDPVPMLEYAKINDGIEAYLDAQWERLHDTPEEEMEPETGPQCWEYGGCPVRIAGECPMFSADVRKQAKTIQDRVRAARALRDEIKGIVDMLKVELGHVEQLEVDGDKVGYKASPTESYPLDEAIQIGELNFSGITLPKKSIVKAAGGKRNLDKNSGLSAAIAAIAEAGVRTTFEF